MDAASIKAKELLYRRIAIEVFSEYSSGSDYVLEFSPLSNLTRLIIVSGPGGYSYRGSFTIGDIHSLIESLEWATRPDQTP